MKDYNYKFFFSFFAIVSLFLLVSLPTIAGQGSSFNRIVFFGDSLSDNGNLFSYDFGFLPKSPPYFDGRFSNGVVWSEYFSEYFYEKNLATSVNFAFGGETAILHDPLNGFLPYSLTMSIDSYLLRSVLSDRSRSLFIIWIGSNDYLKGAYDVDALTTKVIDSIKYSIERLIYYGGMNFLIVNIPDSAKTPQGRASPFQETLHELTISHNAKLRDAVAEIQEGYKSVNIQLYDVYSLFEKLVADPEAYNKKYNLKLVDVQNSCWGGGYLFRKNNLSETPNEAASETAILNKLHERIQKQSRSLKNKSLINNFNQEGFARLVATSPALREAYRVTEEEEEGVKPCNNPDGYVFWDRLHPSAIMHVMLARGLIEFAEQNYSQTYGFQFSKR